MATEGAADRARDDFPIRGRVDELRVIDHLVQDLSAGIGSLLVIEGPPGIGKSRLLGEVRRRMAVAVLTTVEI